MLIAIAATSALAINVYLPSMPAMAVYFGVDFATIQLTLSLYLATVAVGQLIVGPLSDRFGRRPVILGGLLCFVVGTSVCLLAPSIGVLLAGRVLQALGGCAGLALSRAVVRDIYGREQAASMIGYVTMGMAVAPMLAPTLGGVLEALYGWRAGFAFLLVFGGFTVSVAFFRLYETHRRRSVGSGAVPLLQGLGRLLRSGPFWGYALTTAFSTSVFFSFVAGASYVTLTLMGRSPLEYGIYFAMVPGGYLLGNFLTGRFASRVGPDPMIVRGSVLILFSVGTMATVLGLGVEHPLVLFLPMFFVGVGNGLVIPSGIAGAISVNPEMSGTASGVSGSLQMGVGALVAPLVGALIGTSYWPMLAVMGSCAVLALISFGLVWCRRR